MKRPLIAILLASLTLPVLVAGSAAGASCPLPRQETAELPGGKYARVGGDVGGIHSSLWVEIWTETNGEPGLQTYRFRCSAGDVTEPDLQTAHVCTRYRDLFCVISL